MNRTSIIGRVGKHAELRRAEATGSVAISFSLAVSRKYNNAQGVAVESTTWFNCTKWVKKDGSTKVSEFLVPGQQVLVEGEISARGWLDRENKPQASLELNVFALELLGSANKDQQPAAANTGAAVTQPQNDFNVPVSDDLPF